MKLGPTILVPVHDEEVRVTPQQSILLKNSQISQDSGGASLATPGSWTLEAFGRDELAPSLKLCCAKLGSHLNNQHLYARSLIVEV